MEHSGVGETNVTCICCNNLLRVPSSVSCFRCTICDTVTDLVESDASPDDPEPQEGLTLQTLRALTGNSERFLQEVRDVFSNHRRLNAGFRNGVQPSLESPGLALASARETYRLIADQGIEAEEVLFHSIDRLLHRPGRPLDRVKEVQFLMVLFENPYFHSSKRAAETTYRHQILGRLLGLLSCLSNQLHHYVVNWLKRLPLTFFQQRVGLVNHFISYRLAQVPGVREGYPSDWAIKSAARVMALLSAANMDRDVNVPVADFYNTVVDYVDLTRDFTIWQKDTSGAFAFCQYPFLISLGGKMRIMEEDAKREMTEKFRDAFYRTALSGMVVDPFLTINVRRNHLIEDSLNQLQSRHFDLKKKLRIIFANEEGVDAGGLTKEWFLLLIRDLFDPQYGMFTYDEDSRLCWFNPASFENTEEFRLVGTIIGLAIYNSNILDVHFPLACFKKLLDQPVTLEDLKTLRPAFGRGLQQLLDYEQDDIEEVFCRDFVAEYDAFGNVVRVPLVPGGEHKPVTKENKAEFVRLYVDWVLNKSVDKQFTAFKAGFGYVCGGNALSLFRPTEIELMVRGGTEFELRDLAANAEYEGFSRNDKTITDFWQIVDEMPVEGKRKLLLFVTGTDRIPANGIENLPFKISCLGEDSDRLPTAHTCFNQLGLYKYATKEKLKDKLERAIEWSSGFYVK
ncbi:putative E3 ubiquitin-protein ligase [Gaertneriomyces sp. JEL0708]|nr:putative E3 ubiquitin-protein ligase [Gaertneriomyces sp. JEL0708]